MSRVMKVTPADSLIDRAYAAVHEADRAGQLPLKWTMGRDVYNRLRRDSTPEAFGTETLIGIPFVVDRSAPHDLLELDSF